MRLRVLAAGLLTACLTLAPVRPALAQPPAQAVDTLTQVFSLLVEDHYTHPDPDAVLQGAIKGMLDAIHDPFTNYLSPAEYQDFMDHVNGSYAGIGIGFKVSADGKRLQITQVYPGTPAEKAGLQAGDLITAVDGLTLDETNVADAPTQILGEAGTQVTLQVVRGTAAPVAYTLTRAQIDLPTVLDRNLGDGTYYIQITTFGSRTADEFAAALQKASPAKATGLVIDLRGNGGGYVETALEIADMLLDHGTILIVHDDLGQPEAIDAEPDQATTLPIAVLVDQDSASAAEILAGALQKNGRAQLVGSRTFGKGTMQEPLPLPNGGVLKVSIDRWELADGQSPDKVGLKPDLSLGYEELDLNAAELLLSPHPPQLRFDRKAGQATLDGHTYDDAPQPVNLDGALYLPLRYTLEALGSQVDWQPEIGAASFRLAGRKLLALPATEFLSVDGAPLTISRPVRSIDGRTYLAAGVITQLTGIPVSVTDSAVTLGK